MKKMTKRLLGGFVAAALAVTLAGCNSGNNEISDDYKDNEDSISENYSSPADEHSENEPAKLGIWDVLPEIEVTSEDNFKYEYSSSLGGVVITDYTGDNIRVRIPETFEGEPVVKIDMSSCEKELTEAVMPDTVKEFDFSEQTRSSIKYINYPRDIERAHFGDYQNLEAVYIPESITEIGNYAFSNCTGLTGINIPDSVAKIGYMAFYGCDSLTSINISDSVTDIGSGAFFNTPWLENKRAEDPIVVVNNILVDGRECSGDVVIPDGVTKVIGGAFIGSGIVSITIPDSVTEIGDMTFLSCTSLASINIPNSVAEIGRDASADTPWLENKCAEDTLVTVNNIIISGRDCSGDFTIPDGVIKVSGGAFTGSKITSVSIPDSVTEIGEFAFSGCSSLLSITIPDSVTKLGNNAFWGSENMQAAYKGRTYTYDHIYDLYNEINGN